MAEAVVYNQKGEESKSVDLPKRVFEAKWRADLVHQVVEGMRSNMRSGNADTKGRGEVSGGGKKPWKQKGTGRARHGSSRSPIWVGGGVAHGPKSEKDYSKTITKKMRAQALFSVLTKKLNGGEIIFIDSLEPKEIKTKNAISIMQNLAKKTKIGALARGKKPRVLVALWSKAESTEKSFGNLPQIDLIYVKDLNPVAVLNHRYLLIESPEESVKFLDSRGEK